MNMRKQVFCDASAYWHPETHLPPAVAEQLDRLTSSLCEAPGQNLVGLYLHGSLAMGCFNPARSDLDLLMITQEPLRQAAAKTLLGALLLHSGRPRPVEISTVHYAQINPWRHPTPFDLHFSEAHRARLTALLANSAAVLAHGEVDGDLAAHFTVLLRRGRCLRGAPIDALGIETPWSDYLDSLRSDFVWSQTPGNADAVYAVLNACRIWAAIEGGLVLSKAEGAVWASTRAPMEFLPAIECAAAQYAGTPREPEPFDGASFIGWLRVRLGW